MRVEHVDRRNGEIVSTDPELVADGDFAPAHQQHVAARSADFHRDEVVAADGAAVEVERAGACRRPGKQQGGRPGSGLLHRDRAAVVLNEQQGAVEPEVVQARGEPLEIADGEGRDVGVHHRGRGAFIFPEYRGDVDRGERPPAGPVLAQHLQCPSFVGVVDEAVEQAYRHRLHAFAGESLGGSEHVRLRQRLHACAVAVEPSPHPDAQVPRHQRRRKRFSVVERVLAVSAPDVEAVAKPSRGDETHPRAPAFEDGVGGDGGAVHEKRAVSENRLDAGAERLGGQVERGKHAGRGVGGHRQRLEPVDLVPGVGHHEVGEGAAAIDPHVPSAARRRGRGDGGRGHADRGAIPFLRSSSTACSVLRKCPSPMPCRTWSALVNWMLV